MPLFKIGNKEIGDNQPSFIVAEIGANHNGDINLAKKYDFMIPFIGIHPQFYYENIENFEFP